MFSRVFSIISGITLDEYVRNRKLTNAAYEIVSTDNKIIDIALKYGYENQSSFIKAFKNYHGYTPKEVRKIKKYKVFSPMYFYLNLKGGDKMKVKIEDIDSFKIAGISLKTNNTEEFGKIWDELVDKYDIEYFLEIGNGKAYGVCYDIKENNEFSYFAGFDFQKEYKNVEENGLKILEIPKAQYAIFSLKGKVPECIHEGWKYAVEVFLPENGYIHAESPDLEVYGPGDINSENYKMELWVPIKSV